MLRFCFRVKSANEIKTKQKRANMQRVNVIAPIRECESGLAQVYSYHNAELAHEALVEVSTPFAASSRADATVNTFLLCGDQNSGKTSFLHSFVFEREWNWTSLTRLLPILSSSWSNLHIPRTGRPPMDEPPFLDTDVAKTTVLLSNEDFQFYLQENNIHNRSLLSDDAMYAMLQLVEVGGDHLDDLSALQPHQQVILLFRFPSLALHACSAPHATNMQVQGLLADTLERTRALLSAAKKILYFINATSLFVENQSTLAFVSRSLETFRNRIEFLRKLNCEISFGLCRIAKSDSQRFQTQAVCLLSDYLESIDIHAGDIAIIEHFNADGSINTDAQLKTFNLLLCAEVTLSLDNPIAC